MNKNFTRVFEGKANARRWRRMMYWSGVQLKVLIKLDRREHNNEILQSHLFKGR